MVTAPRRRPPGSTDVARLAGVSQKTVSRVLNGERHVSEAVRQRVLDAARELGYRRNNAARALLSGRTRRLGVVSLGTALYGPSTLLVATERAARPLGYALSVATTPEGEPGLLREAVERLLDEGVDGVVVSEPIDEGPVDLVLDVPVLVLGPGAGITAPTVITEQTDAGEAARRGVEHLLGLGHRTVHHVAGPQRWYSARDRLDGWRRALEADGRDVVDPLEGDWTAPSGYALGARLALDRDVTAVLVANDDMAIGLVRALEEAGRRVPEDVSVVGFDDIPVAAYVRPPLTTFFQDFALQAEWGLTQLVRAVDPETAPETGDVAPPVPQLMVRASTGPAPRPRTRSRT